MTLYLTVNTAQLVEAFNPQQHYCEYNESRNLRGNGKTFGNGRMTATFGKY